VEADPVLYHCAKGVATVTLNRPENRNSMTPDVMAAFRAAVRRARDERDLRVLVITGSGRSFCAGADFRGASPAAAEAPPDDAPLAAQRALATYAPFLDVLDVEVPTIAAMNGHAIGGGLGLALVCDLRVASRDARYGANFARLGFHSGMAISYLLPRIVGVPAAADLLFTGRLISGGEAEALGLVHEAVEPGEVAAAARRRAEAVAACAPLAVRLMKRSLYRGLGWDPRSAAEAEAFAQSATLATQDAREGIRALLEKRDPVFEGR
jgi:enoyl-CoA hydratase/carnithine racemase